MTYRKSQAVLLLGAILISFHANANVAASKKIGPNREANPNEITTGGKTEGTGSLGPVLELQKGTKLIFAKVEDAEAVLMTKDIFIKSLSPFDRSARLKTDKFVSEEEFLKYIANQVRPWTAKEKQQIGSLVGSISTKLSRFKLNLPERILLIKTNGMEEGGAAHCRKNAIVLPQGTTSEDGLIHELFHILTAHNMANTPQFYRIIGFEKCNEIVLPDTLKPIKITNPDAPENNYYIRVEYGGRAVDVVPIIYSVAPKYDVRRGGEFFNYLMFKLLVVEKVGRNWQFKSEKGKPVLLDVAQVPDYFDKIGMNTNYIIHPEEILADNFVFMVQRVKNLRSQWVVEKMERLLRNGLSNNAR